MIEPETPDWVRDAVFYQIFPDRFARSLSVPKPAHIDEWGASPTPHGYQGGDLLGVVEHLDYLTDLGFPFRNPASEKQGACKVTPRQQIEGIVLQGLTK